MKSSIKVACILTAWTVVLMAADPAVAGGVTYSYDKLSRLTQVTYGDGTTITYTYDRVGNRISETVSAI